MGWTAPSLAHHGKVEVPSIMQITTVGLDIAKHVFQVHGIDAHGHPLIKRCLRRTEVLRFFGELPPCLVGIEACATAHYWARELTVLGHQVRLMPPQYVRPFVKRNKNDAADAEAICEAVTRPTMRFVPIKSAEQQSVLMLHRARDLLVRPQTHDSKCAAGAPGRVRDHRGARHSEHVEGDRDHRRRSRPADS